MKQLLLFIAIINLSLGCKQAAKPHITSYIRYLSEDLQTDVEFRVLDEKDSTRCKKIDDAFFNDGAMERKENKVQGLFYQAIRNGKYPDAFAFRFKDEKKAYSTSIKAAAIDGLSVKDSLAHKLNGMLIAWKGEPLRKDETLTVLVTDSEETVAEAKIQGATTKTETFVPGAMFSGLKNGKGTVYVVKRRAETVHNEELMIDSVVEFYSKSVKVNLVEK